MRRATWAIAALLLTGVVALVASIAIDTNRASSAPPVSTGPTGDPPQAPSPAPAAPGPVPAAPPAASGVATPSATPDGMVSIPPVVEAAALPETECDKRMAENESTFAGAVESGRGAAFHCVTRCATPTALRIPPSRADDVPSLRKEVDVFRAGATALGENDGEVCRTDSGPRAEPTSLLDTLLGGTSLLRDDVADPLLPSGSGFEPLPWSRTGPFIPADAMEGDGLTGL